MLSDLVKQVNLNPQMQNNFRDTFQGQLTFPPPLPPIGRPEPLTVPDFPPPFYLGGDLELDAVRFCFAAMYDWFGPQRRYTILRSSSNDSWLSACCLHSTSKAWLHSWRLNVASLTWVSEALSRSRMSTFRFESSVSSVSSSTFRSKSSAPPWNPSTFARYIKTFDLASLPVKLLENSSVVFAKLCPWRP